MTDMEIGYYFSMALDGGRLRNLEPAESPAELVEMFIAACQAAVDRGRAEEDEVPQWHAYAMEQRNLTPVEDAALMAAFEQKTGKSARWSHE